MKAVILAGGKGARLGALTKEVPKPMIKIGGGPVLEHQINLLKKYGIKDIIVLTGYLSEMIEEYFGDGNNLGVNISYFKEKKPLGTTGGIKEIEDKLKKDFLVLYGDIMVNMDLERLVDFHQQKDGICTLVVHPNDHPYDSDLVEIDKDQKIIAFHPKPHEENKYHRNLVNACLYVMSPEILKYIKTGAKADFGRDVFPKIVKKETIYGYNTAEYLKDIGTPARLQEVREDYESGKIGRLNRENKRKAIFLDRDGVINKDVNLLHRIEDFELLPKVSEAIRKINNSEFLAIVITNQSVVARNLCSIEELEEIHKKMETLLGRKRAKLDAIYYCPHHPDKGYPEENPKHKIECNCRKPKIGLVKKAEKEFNIDLKNSYFIGDSFRDIECGKNAGMTTIGVKTGDGCRDCKVKPDFMFENLYQAVNFIIQENDQC
jgi:D,D-heptose 1,7-bisphosphate phosphatase